MVKIYVLICPIDNRVKYVGRTAFDLRTRLNCHFGGGSGSKKKTAWIKLLKANNLRPTIKQIDEVVSSESLDRENYWIDFYKRSGFDLTNVLKNKPSKSK